MKKAKISQLKQFTDERKLYLRLIAFLQHQYYSRQDIFVDIFLRSVRSTKNSALHQLENEDQLTRSERCTAVKHLTKSRQGYKSLIDEITEVTHSIVLTDKGKVQKIAELLKEHADVDNEKEQKQIEKFEKSLDEIAKDKNYFDILEKLSRKLQNRVSDILKVISFNPENSDKILLFIHIADGIKSGKLNLKQSYRYLAIQDYLVDKVTWKSQRNELLKLAGLEKFSDYNVVMKKLIKLLDEKYHTVNQRVSNNLNPYLSFDEKSENFIQINTPALDEKETKHISVFLNQLGYIPVLKILSDVNHVTKFTKSFTHHSVKNSKTKADAATFYAGIIGLGCNIGVPKMAQISSGINQNTMSTTVNWFFSLKTLNAANERIREFINRLVLPHIFADIENQRHGSSDGRKVGVSMECLLAAYSF